MRYDVHKQLESEFIFERLKKSNKNRKLEDYNGLIIDVLNEQFWF